MKEILKKEIHEYITNQNLSSEEIKIIDNYVKEIIDYLEPIIALNESLSDKKQAQEFTRLVLKDLGDRIG